MPLRWKHYSNRYNLDWIACAGQRRNCAVACVPLTLSLSSLLFYIFVYHFKRTKCKNIKTKLKYMEYSEWMNVFACMRRWVSETKIEFFILHDEERWENRKTCALSNCIGVSRNVRHGRPVASERRTACMLFVNKFKGKQKHLRFTYFFFVGRFCAPYIDITRHTHFPAKRRRIKKNCNRNRNRNKSPVELALSWVIMDMVRLLRPANKYKIE